MIHLRSKHIKYCCVDGKTYIVFIVHTQQNAILENKTENVCNAENVDVF
jgi:hypothetical protein